MPMFCRGNNSCKNNHLLQIVYMEAFWDGVLSHKKEGLLNVRGRHRAYRRGGKRVLYLGGRQGDRVWRAVWAGFHVLNASGNWLTRGKQKANIFRFLLFVSFLRKFRLLKKIRVRTTEDFPTLDIYHCILQYLLFLFCHLTITEAMRMNGWVCRKWSRRHFVSVAYKSLSGLEQKQLSSFKPEC